MANTDGKLTDSAFWQGLKDFAAGTGAGVVGKLAEYPLDTLKVRLQLEHGAKFVEVAKQIFRSQGMFGFYRGVASPVLGSAAENAVLFTAFGQTSRVLWGKDSPPPMPIVLLSGMIGGVAVATVLTPVELVKCRMQAQTDSRTVQKYRSTFHCLMQTIKDEGVRKGLFRGHTATLFREIPGNAAWFGAYETFCRFLTPEGKKRSDLHPGLVASAGALGGTCYWTIFYPADVIKSNMQTGTLPQNVNSFAQAFKYLYAQNGMKGLYRGLGVTLMRAIPGNALIFLTYETLHRWLSTHDKKE